MRLLISTAMMSMHDHDLQDGATLHIETAAPSTVLRVLDSWLLLEMSRFARLCSNRKLRSFEQCFAGIDPWNAFLKDCACALTCALFT